MLGCCVVSQSLLLGSVGPKWNIYFLQLGTECGITRNNIRPSCPDPGLVGEHRGGSTGSSLSLRQVTMPPVSGSPWSLHPTLALLLKSGKDSPNPRQGAGTPESPLMNSPPLWHFKNKWGQGEVIVEWKYVGVQLFQIAFWQKFVN